MKKRFLILCIALLSGVTMVSAWERPGFEWSVGADLTSSYLWRGMKYGGAAFQPEVSLGYAGVKLTGWANIGVQDYTFTEFTPELDITLSYSVAGFTIGLNHLYYFDGSDYFGFKASGIEAYRNGEQNSSQTEAFAEFALGELVESAPLTIGWYTYIAGDDKYITEDGKLKRAYSSYLEVSYEGSLPLGFTLTPAVGMTPWKSCYNFYEGGFSVNNISLKLNWELELGDHFCFDVYAIGMLNTYGINKYNIVTEISDSYANQRLNGAVGIGLWLY